MQHNRNFKLITKVLAIGLVIAVLSYLFHPEAGQLSVMYNGQPIADPLVHFAAIPTFLIMIGFAALLMVLLFLGISVFIFIGTVFVVLVLSAVIAPYFWPVLVVIFLIIALMSFSHEDKG